MGVQVIPIPTEVVSHSSHSHSHSQFCVLFPFPWDSHGIPGPIGNPIPCTSLCYRRTGVTDLCNACSDWSTVKECRATVRQDVGDKNVGDMYRKVRTGRAAHWQFTMIQRSVASAKCRLLNVAYRCHVNHESTPSHFSFTNIAPSADATYLPYAETYRPYTARLSSTDDDLLQM